MVSLRSYNLSNILVPVRTIMFGASKNNCKASLTTSSRCNHFQLTLILVLLACAPRPAKAWIFESIVDACLILLCNIPVLNSLLPFCHNGGCGGEGGKTCLLGEFCEKPAGTCGDDLQSGICVPTPDACFFIYLPVCGCDGVTYGNDCDRQMAGVSKDSDGPCGESCRGDSNNTCSHDEFCDLATGTCGDGTDAEGECVLVPEACSPLTAMIVFDKMPE